MGLEPIATPEHTLWEASPLGDFLLSPNGALMLTTDYA